jgi:hypothetical protein
MDTDRVGKLTLAVVAAMVVCGSAACSSGPGRSGPAGNTSGAPPTPAHCPVRAAEVSAALSTKMVATDTNSVEQRPSPLCVFIQPSGHGLEVTVSAFPFTSGPHRGQTLDAIRTIKPPAGVTVKIAEHPEWGPGSFAVLQTSSGPAVGESWSPRYASTVVDLSAAKRPKSTYMLYATRLGRALAAVSR